MNITDVGHLASDSDEGEDKLEKGAKREGKTAREVADFYAEDFYKNFAALGLQKPDHFAKATDFIPQQLDLVKILMEKGFAYQTEQAIYFEVTKLDDYGKLTGQNLSDKEVGARSDVVTDPQKRNPQDFALWFFAVGRFDQHEMRWSSPWGEGFPGWHLECSAIIHALLGDPIDIHTGGIDHIGTHHTNEIAQTEAAYEHPLANYWLHNNHLMVEGQKISKSLNNGITLQDLAAKGFSPLDFKVEVLYSHYRSQSNFTWEALAAAKNRLKAYGAFADLKFQTLDRPVDDSEIFENKISELAAELNNDINTHNALVVLDAFVDVLIGQGLAEANLHDFQNFLNKVDDLLGLQLASRDDIPEAQKNLINQREAARHNKDWQQADALRAQLSEQAIEINDTAHGPIWYRIN
jgi:cysteinyl-tRNA synthetase